MPITDHYARLPLGEIYIDRQGRQRREVDIKNLLRSIELRGVLNPIIVEREAGPDGLHKLTAGERRYKASKELGLPDIPVRFADELSPEESQILELEENIKRENLTWQDEAVAIQRIHNLYCGFKSGWFQKDTAGELGLSEASISQYLSVAANLDQPRIQNATTIGEAIGIIKRKTEREEAAKMDHLIYGAPLVISSVPLTAINLGDATQNAVTFIEPPKAPVHDYTASLDGNPAKNILLESFLMWAPKYTGPAFNFIHCDFPYGINVFEGPQAGANRHISYDDSRELHFKLLETLLVHFDRLASTSCHVMYWFSMQHYNQIREMIAEIKSDILVQVHPLIWHKTDNTGIAPDPRHGPRHIYETALVMSRGKRPIVNLASDAYGAPTDNKTHIHAKPEPMLRYFFQMFVDEFTIFLDPTCGGGSSIRAAESLGAKTVVGMDIDADIVGNARRELREARAKRTASLGRRIAI